jgi:HSP20 family protein
MAEQSKTKQPEQKPTESAKGDGGALMTHRPRSLARSGTSFGPFDRLRNEFNRVFDRFFGWPAAWEEGGPEWRGQDWHWGLDLDETDSNVVVRAEAPGFEPQDFDIQVRGDQLTLCACKKAETEEEARGFREWRQHEFYRSVTLPAAIDADKVDAQYKNGVLTITMRKTEESKGRRIEVKG